MTLAADPTIELSELRRRLHVVDGVVMRVVGGTPVSAVVGGRVKVSGRRYNAEALARYIETGEWVAPLGGTGWGVGGSHSRAKRMRNPAVVSWIEHGPNQADLKKLVEYYPGTGIFRSPRSGREMGRVSDSTGYLMIGVGGRTYLAHRLAFLYMTGSWPNVVDHINGVKTDNRWLNMRDVDCQTNCQNRYWRTRPKNPHLPPGVNPAGSKFTAVIGIGKRQSKYLGTFATAEEAQAAHLAAKRIVHPGFVPERFGFNTDKTPCGDASTAANTGS